MLDLRYRYQMIVFSARILMLDIRMAVVALQVSALDLAIRFLEWLIQEKEN